MFGEVGLIYLLFTIGIELDLSGFIRAPESAALFGLTSFGPPFVVGTLAGVVFLELTLLASLLLAAVFASHTLLAYPVVNRLKITKNRVVTAVFGGILFTDTLALVILAIVLGAADGGLTIPLFIEIFVALAILFLGVWLLLPRIARWFFQSFSEESYFEFLFVLAAVFTAASLAALLEIAPILGAFVAGLALNRLIAQGGTLMTRIEFVGNALFIPFFLIHVGMLVDFGVILDGWRTLHIAAFIIGTMLLTKWMAAWVVSTIQNYEPYERDTIFGEVNRFNGSSSYAVTNRGASMFHSNR